MLTKINFCCCHLPHPESIDPYFPVNGKLYQISTNTELQNEDKLAIFAGSS